MMHAEQRQPSSCSKRFRRTAAAAQAPIHPRSPRERNPVQIPQPQSRFLKRCLDRQRHSALVRFLCIYATCISFLLPRRVPSSRASRALRRSSSQSGWIPPKSSWIPCCRRTTFERILRSEVTIEAQVSSAEDSRPRMVRGRREGVEVERGRDVETGRLLANERTRIDLSSKASIVLLCGRG